MCESTCESQYLSKKDYQRGERMEPHPRVEGALAELPSSLTSLNLSEISLTLTDFDLCAGLTSLRHLTLSQCGDHGMALAERLLYKKLCPLLKRAGCFVRGGTLNAYGHYSGNAELVCLDPEVEREKAARKATEAAAAKAGGSPSLDGSRPASSLADSSGTAGVDHEMEDSLEEDEEEDVEER